MSSITSVGMAAVQRSQRNTTALFGVGQINAIPAEVIEAIAKRKHEDFPRISGRVHRMADGHVGRFGWKAQESTLYDFTMTACAVEVRLHVGGLIRLTYSLALLSAASFFWGGASM